ncbi:UNVERIFIED_CONTAM: Zinc finger BED domain-containing protein RICESLEEPER 2 [Sesamum calycinum]|uniref:Zinc finger BED domain-containing protein RICESLEEPER 2 n=1 Tax=Sesamum calycinum TaxID=2727403 RepID=A0AAW2J7I0_9LAMI
MVVPEQNEMVVLEPSFEVPSRHTIGRDCMKIFIEEKKKLKKLFKSERVCLTTDTWTSLQNLNYMCLTTYWIDGDWELQKRIINFYIVENHKENDWKKIEECLHEWGIDKVCTITVDNASSNDRAIAHLKKKCKWKDVILNNDYMHMRCSTHIVNLIVKEGLEEQHESIMRVRNAVKYVRSSPARLKAFKRCVEKEKIDSKSLLCLDVETRWNSTYLMLDAAEKFEKAFERLGDEEQKFIEYFDYYELNQEECEGKKGKVNKGDYHMASMAIRMRDKFNKYWGNIDNMNWFLFVAILLDPSLEHTSKDKDSIQDNIFMQLDGEDDPVQNIHSFKIAKDVLAIPVSTVASKSAFSTSGRVIDAFRRSRSPKMVEALICTQDWLRATPQIDLCAIMEDIEKFEEFEKELEGSSSCATSKDI